MAQGFKQKHLIGICLLIAVLIFLQSTSFAAVSDENALDAVVKLYQNNVSAWEGSLQKAAMSLFGILATIQLSIAAIRLLFQKADVNEWAYEFINQGLYLGFFSYLLLNSSDVSNSIIAGFTQAADAANGAVGGVIGLSPSDIFEIGLNISGHIVENPPNLNITYMLIMAISALTILICFAVMAALLVVALIESYIVISAGGLFFGFGGCKWTSDLALKVLRYVVSVGAKLFVLRLLIGLGQRIMLDWLTTLNTVDIDTVLAIVGSSFVFVLLTLMVPNIIQGLINGTSFSMSSPGQIAAAATSAALTAVGIAAGGTGMVGGAVSALQGAGALANEQQKNADFEGSGSLSRKERMAQWTANFAENLGNATIEDVGGRLSGSSRHGYMGGRMGQGMRESAASLRKDREKEELKRKEAEQKKKNEQPANTIGGDKEHE